MALPLAYGLRSTWRRRTNALATSCGIGLVVFVLASSLMLAAGIRATLLSASSPQRALVLEANGYAEPYSRLPQSAVALVAAAPGVKRSSSGAPLVSGEVVVLIPFNKRGGAQEMYSVQVRGVTEASFAIRPEIRVIDGRLPKLGTAEAIIGKAALDRYEGLTRHGGFELKKNMPFKIVGVFDAGGAAYESEVWADLDGLRTSFGWQGNISCITAVLDSSGAFDRFARTVNHDPRQGMQAEPETAYYRRLSQDLSEAMQGLGAIVAFICALGALLGAMITMYGSAAERRREIATLRALGFSAWSVFVTFLFESSMLAALGGVVGAALALLTSFLDFTTTNVSTDQVVTFHFLPQPALLLGAFACGTLVGLCGGLFPAWKAATASPLHAIRAR
jgi:putative ABC transport system permease protein